MKIFLLRTTKVEEDDGEINVDDRVSCLTKAATTHLRRLTAGNGIELVPATRYCDHAAAALLLVDEGRLQIAEPSWMKIAKDLRDTLDEVKKRYAEAFRNQVALERIGNDLSALAFNRTAWQARALDGEFWLFPSTPLEWHYDPMDPALLACGEPDDDQFDTIVNALVAGVREVNNPQRGLFQGDDKIEVLISLRHRIPEVRHTTTLEEAQQIWQGRTRLTAKVRLKLGELPEVIDGLQLVRE
jgi:hypothetical protein